MRNLPLHELISALDAVQGADGYLPVLRSMPVATQELERLATWNVRHYTRNVLVQREGYELLLICFEPGQRTSIHDYDSENAFVHPVLGEVLEERFTLDAEGRPVLGSQQVLNTGAFSHLQGGNSIHRYTNLGGTRAMSLNLYAPPLRKWRVYDERSGRARTQHPGT